MLDTCNSIAVLRVYVCMCISVILFCEFKLTNTCRKTSWCISRVKNEKKSQYMHLEFVCWNTLDIHLNNVYISLHTKDLIQALSKTQAAQITWFALRKKHNTAFRSAYYLLQTVHYISSLQRCGTVPLYLFPLHLLPGKKRSPRTRRDHDQHAWWIFM